MEFTKWEYMTIGLDKEYLDKYGKSGWEAVGISNPTGGGSSVLLKRPSGRITVNERTQEEKQARATDNGYQGYN